MHASLDEFLQFAQEHFGHKEHEAVLKILYSEFLEGLTPSESPILLVVGGSPGSGKSTYRNAFFKRENTHLHDMDEALVKLPGYQKDLKEFGPTKAFENWWPTAREIADLCVQFALQSRFSIVYDRTCGAEGTYFDILRAKQMGYKIHLVGLFVDYDVAKERISKRLEITGRAVTEDILQEYRARFCSLWPYYLELADEATLFLNNTDERKIIYSSKEGVLQPELYEEFLESGASFQKYFAQLIGDNS